MTRYLKRLLAILLATLLFVLEIGTLSWANLVIGAVVATLFVGVSSDTVFRNPGDPPGLGTRLRGLVPFVAATVGHVLRGTVQVAGMVVAPEPNPRPEVVDIPFEQRRPLGVYVTGLTLTLSPGSYLLEIDWEQRRLYVHAVGVDDIDATREEYQRLYRNYQRDVFP